MSVTPRLKLLLAALGLLLAVLLVRSLGSGKAPPPPPSRFVATEELLDDDGAAPRARGRKAQERPRGVTALKAADLDRVPPSFTMGRDPWRFIDPPPPLPPPPPPGPTADQLRQIAEAQQRALEAQRERDRLAAIDRATPKPAEFTMEYLGNFGPKERRIAVFSDGKDVHNAREGEVIDQQFIVARIGLESVDIEFVGFPDWPAKRLAVRSR